MSVNILYATLIPFSNFKCRFLVNANKRWEVSCECVFTDTTCCKLITKIHTATYGNTSKHTRYQIN
jgi:hypothetical protein